MSNSGDCFVVLPPISNAVLCGRNSLLPEGEVQEIIFHSSSGPVPETETCVCDGGAEIERSSSSTFSMIVQKSAGIWGCESGANEKNVCISITWADGEPNNDDNSVKSTDIVRLALERSATADDGVNIIGDLITKYGNENAKFSFVVCDLNEVWLLSVGGKLWAAEKISNGFQRIPSNGLAVTTKIDKSIENLNDKLKDQGFWNGDDDINFAKLFDAIPVEVNWPTDLIPTDNNNYNVRGILEVLRSVSTDSVRSSNVSALLPSGVACHWFTGTPNPCESVYKPFVFGENPKVSPLTKSQDDGDDNDKITLLYQLHSQRNWKMVGKLLKSLEGTCIDEVDNYLCLNPEPNQELDELMKDCVEAEVKFYR